MVRGFLACESACYSSLIGDSDGLFLVLEWRIEGNVHRVARVRCGYVFPVVASSL